MVGDEWAGSGRRSQSLGRKPCVAMLPCSSSGVVVVVDMVGVTTGAVVLEDALRCYATADEWLGPGDTWCDRARCADSRFAAGCAVRTQSGSGRVGGCEAGVGWLKTAANPPHHSCDRRVVQAALKEERRAQVECFVEAVRGVSSNLQPWLAVAVASVHMAVNPHAAGPMHVPTQLER